MSMYPRTERPAVPAYLQIPPDPKEDYFFDENKPHLSITHQILNSTRCSLYVRDLTGTITKIPSRPLISDRGDVICVNTTYCSFKSKINKTISKNRYKITPSRVSKGRAVFIKELGMYFSVDESFLKNLPVFPEIDDEDKKSIFVSKVLDNLKQCPIRVIINDPTEELKNVYGVLGNRVYRIPVINTPQFGGTCIIQFASKVDDEAEQIFEFDIDELKDSFEQHGCIHPTVGGYNLLIYPTLLEAEEYLNTILRDQDKRTIGMAAQEKEQMKRVYENRIHQLELTIRDKEAEIAGLKRIMDLTEIKSKRDFNDDQQTKAKIHQLQLQEKQIIREDARAKKSEFDVRSSELGVTSTALKSAATVAPIILSAIGVYFAYQGGGATAIAGLGIGTGAYAVYKGLSSIVSQFGSTIRTGISWVINLFW